MASYTMQLKTYIESFTQYEDDLSHSERIKIGRKHLFDFDYPFFDENYREQFETNFITNFYSREIGFETEGLFKFRLESWLNINMPYYNDLFETTKLDYDPLLNARMTTERETLSDENRDDTRNINQLSNTKGKTSGEMDRDSTAKSDTKDDNFSRKVGSDNPDSRLALQTKEGKGVIEYASTIDENKVNDNSVTNTEGNTKTITEDESNIDSKTDQTDDYNRKVTGKENYKEFREGKIGTESYSRMLMEYRQAILRIEVEIHRELQQLFMLVY